MAEHGEEPPLKVAGTLVRVKVVELGGTVELRESGRLVLYVAEHIGF